MTEGRDVWWHEEVTKWPTYCAPELMSSEDPLFLLYTSGSTGKPKGVMHTTGGYLLGAAMTGKYVFDLQGKDIMGTAGDVGWITGHTYVVYSPLMLGVTTLVFESTPAYPDFSRYWDCIAKHNITQFYVAPTALRLLKRAGDKYLKHNLKSLRVLGSVGEPIADEVWRWYHEKVGDSNCHVVDVCRPFSFKRIVRSANKTPVDILANRNWIKHHHSSRGCNTNQTWKRFPTILWNRTSHHRPCFRRGASWKQGR